MLEFLSAPIKIGKKFAPNRIVNQPMECNDADPFGNPTEFTLDRYKHLAEGTAGIIYVESLTVSPASRARRNQLEITERSARGLETLVNTIRGVNNKSLIIFQINHSGNVSNGEFSEIVSYYPTGNLSVRLLSDKDIEEIMNSFIKAALISREVGADGIDLKMCHGYLGGQLLRPANNRNGRFGGSFENRTSFLIQTAEKIKKALSDDSFILGTRISFFEGIIGGFGAAGPQSVDEDPTEPLALVRIIERLGFDFINVSAGVPSLTPELTRPTKRNPDEIYRHFNRAKAVKEAVRIPVIGSAYSYLRDGKNRLTGNDASKKSLIYWGVKNIQEGNADMIGIGRQSLADPLFAKKVLANEIDSVNFCTACGNCSTLLMSQARVGCTVYNEVYKKELQNAKKR